jgi:hypothetical protein
MSEILEKELIFRTGTWKGRKWTIRDLDQIVENFNRLKDYWIPALIIGHSQKDLEKSSVPAYGWIEKIWREGEKLFARIVDIPKQLVGWVRNKHYRWKSVGIDLQGRDIDGKPIGLVLDHVAILGGKRPEILSLGEVQLNYASEIEYVEVNDMNENYNSDAEKAENIEKKTEMQDRKSEMQEQKEQGKEQEKKEYAYPYPYPKIPEVVCTKYLRRECAYTPENVLECPLIKEYFCPIVVAFIGHKTKEEIERKYPHLVPYYHPQEKAKENKQMQTQTDNRISDLEKENQELRERILKLEHESRVAEVQAFLKDNHDRIPPSSFDIIESLLLNAENRKIMKFSVGEEVIESSNFELLKELISSFPKWTEVQEFARTPDAHQSGNLDDMEKIHYAILEIQEKHASEGNPISYSEAMRKFYKNQGGE